MARAALAQHELTVQYNLQNILLIENHVHLFLILCVLSTGALCNANANVLSTVH